jgi:mRNA-degrading endonuclease toxin of MazEF toxin-antitoxin module
LKRGDPFWAELSPQSGSEQTGRRPVSIVSHGFNQTANWRSIIVVPVLISDVQGRRGLTVVALPAGTASLPHASVAVCHQVTTLDRMKLPRRLGSLAPKILRQVEQAF